MKTLLLFLLCTTSAMAQFAGYAVRTDQLNAAGTAPQPGAFLAPPAGTASGTVFLDGTSATKQTFMGEWGTEFVITRTGIPADRKGIVTILLPAAQVTGLAAVATSGAYSSLSGVPTNLSAFTNGPGYLLPADLAPYATTVSMTSALASYVLTSAMTSAMATKMDNPSGTTLQYIRGDGSFATSPTDLSSFTNGPGFITSSALSPYATSAAVTAALAGKFDIPAGTTLQYVRGDGTLASFPTIPSAQVQTDWNAVSGLGVLLNKPGNATTSVSGLMSAADKTKLDAYPNYVAGAIADVTRSIVTSTSATGFQISATQASQVNYTIDLSATSSIAGASSVTVFLETANTNSTTPGDWTTIDKTGISQAVTLAVALQIVQTNPGTLSRVIPAGKYVRIRSTITNTASATWYKGQERLLSTPTLSYTPVTDRMFRHFIRPRNPLALSA